jgi:hypothetical protein
MSAWKADALPLGDSRVGLYSTVRDGVGQEEKKSIIKGKLITGFAEL